MEMSALIYYLHQFTWSSSKKMGYENKVDSLSHLFSIAVSVQTIKSENVVYKALRVEIRYEMILKVENTHMKHLNYTTAKPLHHKALGGVFLFSLTFSVHIRAYLSLPYLVYYWSHRGAGVITQSVAQGSLQNSRTPAELMPHKSHIGSIILVDKSGFMSVCVR